MAVAPYVSAHAGLGRDEAARLLAQALALVPSNEASVRTKGWFEQGFDEALARVDYPATAVLDGAQGRELASALRVTHAALLDVVPGDGALVLTLRVVDLASQRVVLFRTARLDRPGQVPRWGPDLHLVPSVADDALAPPPDGGSWQAWWATTGPDDDNTRRWKALVAPARDRGDLDEVGRLVELIADRLAGPNAPTNEAWASSLAALRREVRALALVVAVDREASQLQALLRPRAKGYPTAAAEAEFVARARTDAGQQAASRPALRAAFQTRFGEPLATALARLPQVPVPPGTYTMGSAEGNADESPLHGVSVGSFWMGQTEVTQAQYQAVVKANPSLFVQGPDAPRRPVERVTWFDAVEFCNLLSMQEGLEPVYRVSQRVPAKGNPITSATVVAQRSKNGYRLPTEAEWEWAARGAVEGAATLLAGGGDPVDVAWTGSATTTTMPVATKAPNALGLYDLSGNVWEWCADWYAKYPAQASVEPEGPEAGVLKVGRGGSWRAAAWNARITSRSYDAPGSRGNVLGFRVVRTISPFPGR